MMVDRLLQSTSEGKLTVFKSGLFGGQHVWLSKLKVLTLQVLCFWRCEREHRPAALYICNGHISPWCRVAICQAPKNGI